ncbi:MAG TPA: hypothetical protein VK895_10015 [Jiangellaceae bacterium]|nr:hypothetical protein [Jiangellaceae bacterium]
MDINHVIAEVTFRQLQDKYASQDWQRRAELDAAVRRTRRSAAPQRRWFRMRRPLVARLEGGVG